MIIMAFIVPDDLVKIKQKQTGAPSLYAELATGEKIPGVTDIIIHSKHGELVRAEIRLIVDVRDLDVDKFKKEYGIELTGVDFKIEDNKLLAVNEKRMSMGIDNDNEKNNI